MPEQYPVGCVVLVDGVEVPCDATSNAPGVLSGLKVTWGRAARLERPAVSTCNFDIVDPDGGTDYASVIAYQSVVEVLATDYRGGRTRVFLGSVTDLVLMHEPGTDAVVSVTVVGLAARLSAVMVGAAAWPEQSASARRAAILAALPSGTLDWDYLSGVSALVMARKDVDNLPAHDLVTDFLWGIASPGWPVTSTDGLRPRYIMTGQGQSRTRVLGVVDTRTDSSVALATFKTLAIGGTTYNVVTVCLDACDIDLDGTEFEASAEDVAQVVRVTYGTEAYTRVYVTDDPAGAPVPPDRTLEISSGVSASGTASEASQVATYWQGQMSYWWQQFTAPWRAGTLRFDPSTATGATTDLWRALLRLLGENTRPETCILLQHLPTWTPWRRPGAPPVHQPNVVGLLQGGTYTYTDGHWVLDLNVVVLARLSGDLAPSPVLMVSPGDRVGVPHNDPTVVPDPATMWAVGEVATFTDGPYGWDGTAWVAGGVRAVVVTPGSTVAVAHDDPRVQAQPATSWGTGQYATFTDGPYRWNSVAWVAMIAVKPGDTLSMSHFDRRIIPAPATPWGVDDYATFTDGRYRWDGSVWVVWVVWSVRWTNLMVDPKPLDAASWKATTSDMLTIVTDGGASAVEAVQAGSATFYAYPVADALLRPGPNQWVGGGFDIKALDASTAETMRVSVNPYGGTSLQGATSVSSPASVTEYLRFTHARQVATYSESGYVRTLIWPGTAPADGGFRARGVVLAIANSEAELMAALAEPWDGDTPSTAEADYSWTGEPNVSASVLRVPGVLPGSNVDVPHDDPAVQPNPATPWAEGDYATFTDDTYRWDGAAWVFYAAPVVAFPGGSVDVSHDDPRVTPEPSSAWGRASAGAYATFTDGLYRWDGDTWQEVVVVTPGDVVSLASGDRNVLPDPVTAWATGLYVTFTDGAYRWSGSTWQSVVFVAPGDTATVSSVNARVVPTPATAWADDEYANFSNGTYRWDGSAWVAWTP